LSGGRSLRRATPPEVLAPVGGRPQLAAAIENGADAVYFGLTAFNARARAANFTPDELPDVMAELHERGVQGFVTLNTLVFDEEWPSLERYADALRRARVDAVIVQDLGVCATLAELAPDLPLHGSTQMTVTSAESANLVAGLGLERVVLGRELSVREIAAVAAGTELEIEVFVHGALCVSYSGQCFSSEAWGGRSANRGRCAQACRLPYDLVVDGRPAGDVDHRYVLSPQDLMGVQHVPALIEAGAACFKIEGRLKGPEYVALTTRVYRDAVDAAWAGRPVDLDAETRRDLQQVFSRGLTPGFLDGPRHQRLVRGRFPKHRGLRVGRVTSISGRRIGVALEGPLRAGDGVVFDGGRPQEEELGGTVHTLLVDDRPADGAVAAGDVVLKLGPKARLRSGPAIGDLVWKTRDPVLVKRLEAGWTSGVRRRTSVDVVVSGAMGEPVRVEVRDARGRLGTASTDRALEPARARALDADAVRAAVDRLGATSLALGALRIDLPDGAFLPISSLNRARRAAAEDLIARRRALRVRETAITEPPARVARLGSSEPRIAPSKEPSKPSVSVLCRDLEQVRAAIRADVDEIAVDFLEVKGLREAVAEVRAAGIPAVAASPRVLKPAEENIRAFLLKLGADAILVRSVGLLHSLLGADDAPALHGDFSLNAVNRRTTDLLLGAGLARLAVGHDLDARQIAALAAGGPERLEVIVHHHLPIFHTEHCVFARFLSDGDDKRTCGAPCETRVLHLEGRDGKRHRVEADMGCRNTVFNARAQSGLRDADRFLGAGIRRFRVELVDHRPDEVAPLVALYRAALDREIDGRDAFRKLRKESRFGAELGSLAVLKTPETADLKTPGWMHR